MELERLEKLVDFAKRYSLSLIPLLPGGKKPAVKWKEMTTEETLSFLSTNLSANGKRYNVGIALKGKIFVIDIDDPDKNKEILEKLMQINTFTVKTRRGYHFYLRAVDFQPKNMKLNSMGIDIKAEGGYVVSPYSTVEGVEYEIINNSEIKEISYNELSQLLNLKNARIEKNEKNENQTVESSKLPEHVKSKIISILIPHWVKGQRNMLALSLAGYLYKSGVSEKDAVSIIERIVALTNDEERKNRIDAVRRTYEKARKGESIKAASGLIDLIGEENFSKLSLSLSNRENISSLISTNRIVTASVSKGIYLIKYKKEGIEIVYITYLFPTKIVVLEDIVTKNRIFDIEFIHTHTYETYCLKGSLQEIETYIRENGFCLNSRNFIDILSAIIEAAVKKGYATVEKKPFSPGVYVVENEVLIKPFEEKEVKYSIEDVRGALILLNQISSFFREEVFATVVKYALISPFSYILKSKGIPIRYLYLYGPAGTGKTTLARIATYIYFGLEKGGGEADTPARLGALLSSTTFPIIINEPAAIFQNDATVEILKAAWESTTARTILSKTHGSILNFVYGLKIRMNLRNRVEFRKIL